MLKETEKGKLQNIPENIPASDLAGLRVLIVEDNEINQQLARASLHRVGAKARIAADGIDALRILEQESFDAVLMDMNMPNVNGIEATRLIRKNPALAYLPIIAMTANSTYGDRERCLAAGMNDYLSKPIEFEQMYAILGRWTQRKAIPQQASPLQATPAGFAVLDSAKAIIRMGGEEKIYLSVLEKFIASQGASVQSVHDALAANDQKTAARLAHSLKGIAATVGAEAMSKIVRALEHAMHQNDKQQCTQLLSNAETEMRRVIAAANEYLSVHKANVQQTYSAHDSTGLANLLEQLGRQLPASDSRAKATMGELKQLLKDTASSQRYALLDSYINVYDYKNALLELTRLHKEE
jgi:CheY-like chemotaxis protein